MAGFVDKFKRLWDAPEDEYDNGYDEYGYAEEDATDDFEDVTPYSTSTRRNKVVNISATAKLQVAIFKPERFGDASR